MYVTIRRPTSRQADDRAPVQRVIYPNMNAMWAAVSPGFNLAHVTGDSALSHLYGDAAARLPRTDFVQVAGRQPEVTAQAAPPAVAPFRLDWDTAAATGLAPDVHAGYIIHELAHAASGEMFRHRGNLQGPLTFASVNLPAQAGAVNPATGTTANQDVSLNAQTATLASNWQDLDAEVQADDADQVFTAAQLQHITMRTGYAVFLQPESHNETVLGDLLYWMQSQGLTDTRTYRFARRMLREANDRRRNGLWSRAGTEVRRVDRNAAWYNIFAW
jgi:hypothetical protein